MLKNVMTTALICSSSLIVTACSTEDVRGVLVGNFIDEETMVTSIVIPASRGGEYHMHFGLLQDKRVCLLSGDIPTAPLSFFQPCEGLSGPAKISCNDGRSLNLRWFLTSCQGGYGRSDERADSRFFFGFGDSEERARDQLDKARQAD